MAHLINLKNIWGINANFDYQIDLIMAERGIDRFSRCLRENLTPHFTRDRPVGVLREQCSLVESEGFLIYPISQIKNRPLGTVLLFGGEGEIQTQVRTLSLIYNKTLLILTCSQLFIRYRSP